MFRGVRSRCVGCDARKHTACENRLATEASCSCECVGADGAVQWWALVETARWFPESVATHAMIAGSLRICVAKS